MGRTKKRNRASQQCARKRILKTRGKRCERCGRTGYVELHHIVPIKEGGIHDDDNLILLCDRCHREAHGFCKRKPGVAVWAVRG